MEKEINMFNKFNVDEVLKDLGAKYTSKVFSSEAQLQLEFAITIYKIYRNRFQCTVEYPISLHSTTCELDLLILDNQDNKYTIIEFKYKTKNSKGKSILRVPLGPLTYFTPSNDGAPNLCCYDVLHDLERTEKLISTYSNIGNGFIIFITNDPIYEKGGKCCYGRAFSLQNGQTIPAKKILGWVGNSINVRSIGRSRKNPICLMNNYKINWTSFYRVSGTTSDHQHFKKLIVEIYPPFLISLSAKATFLKVEIPKYNASVTFK